MNTIALQFLVGIGLPIILLVIYIRTTLRKQQLALESNQPLAPAKREQEPNAFMLRFTPAERVYLRTQMRSLPIILTLVIWLLTFQMTIGIFTNFPHADLWTDDSVMRWYTFVQILGGTPPFATFLALGTAMTTILPLRSAGPAIFYRTRPLSIRFLFWSRVIPALTIVITGFVIATALSLGIFILLHGRPWEHLPAIIPRHLGADDSDIVDTYAALRISSLPRMLLSTLLWTCVLCTAGILALSLPFNARGPIPKRPLFIMLGLFMVIPMVRLLSDFDVAHTPRWLFLYSSPGPPPPWHLATFPMAVALILLIIASRLIRRVEL
jgi:hypothetical protein